MPIAKRLQSELNMSNLTGVVCWPSVTLQLAEATCARPVGLSGIGIDTLGCAEVESELQMGKEREKENKVNGCGVNAYSTKPQRDGLYISLAKDNVKATATLVFSM